MIAESVDTLKRLSQEMSQIIVSIRVTTANCPRDLILIKNASKTLLSQEVKTLIVKSVIIMRL